MPYHGNFSISPMLIFVDATSFQPSESHLPSSQESDDNVWNTKSEGRRILTEIKINRMLTPGTYKVVDVFPEIRTEPAMVDIFGDEKTVDEVFETIDIHLMDRPHYMNVNNENGTINIGLGHLRNSDEEVLYLDIVHELCHVRQQRDGAVLYNREIPYVEWPTEIEAYEVAVKVARRMGMTDREIENYLYVEWASPEDNIRMAKRLGVDVLPL